MMLNHSTRGARRSRRRLRAAPMRKILPAFAIFLAGCSTPAYRPPQVPVPSTYSVSAGTPVAPDLRAASEDVPTASVQVSTALASTPFWKDLGDTTLSLLIREAQRANMDVHIAESRVSSARAAKRLASYDLVPTITGIGSTSRQQFSVAQTPGVTSQLPAQQLWDV